MTAAIFGFSSPLGKSSDLGSRPNNSAKATIPFCPPGGGHILGRAVPDERAAVRTLASVPGIDLRRHENIMVSPPVPGPKDIFAPTRILIVPSLAEPGARVVGEALINGVPPVVSDRGGLPEMCRGAGRVLPLVDDSSLDAWCTTLISLMDDDELYGTERAKAREAAAAFSPDVLRPRYDAYFRALLP